MYDAANYEYPHDEQEFELGNDAALVDEMGDKEAKSASLLSNAVLTPLITQMNALLAEHPIDGRVMHFKENHAAAPKSRLHGHLRHIECYTSEKKPIGSISYVIVTNPFNEQMVQEVCFLAMQLKAEYQKIGLEKFLIYMALKDAFYINYEEDCLVSVVSLQDNFSTAFIDAGFQQPKWGFHLVGSLAKFNTLSKKFSQDGMVSFKSNLLKTMESDE